jgi:DEAD/DEAH box helicase domain-containing protein
VSIGQKDGVTEDTRTDFYIKCIQLERHGEIIEDTDELSAYKDVAIYMDGYTYHASEKHMRFYEDILIRDAINATPNIVAWSLSWSDMVIFEEENEADQLDELFVKSNRYSKTIKKLKSIPSTSQLNLGLLEAKNSIERLIWYLQNSNSNQLAAEVGVLALSFQEEFGLHPYSQENALKLLQNELNIAKETPSADTYFLSDLTEANELFKFTLLARLKDFDVRYRFKIEQLQEIDKEIWAKFWRLYSLFNVMK